jgi:hypothetical protein
MKIRGKCVLERFVGVFLVDNDIFLLSLSLFVVR